MAETSFPVVGQDITDSQWQQIMLSVGSGVLDKGGNPYAMSNVDNATDTLQILPESATGTSEAVVTGFFHRIDAPVPLSVPPVSQSTAYTLALCYDPENATDPIKLGVFKGDLDRSDGKRYLILYTGVRTANMLLSSVQWQKVLPRVVQMLYVNEAAQLPPVGNDVLYGAMAFVIGDRSWWQVRSNNGVQAWALVVGGSASMRARSQVAQGVGNSAATVARVPNSTENGAIRKVVQGAGHAWVAPYTGWYSMNAAGYFDAAGGGTREISALVGAAFMARSRTLADTNAVSMAVNVSTEVWVESGQQMRFQLYHTRRDVAGAGLNFNLDSASVRYLGAV